MTGEELHSHLDQIEKIHGLYSPVALGFAVHMPVDFPEFFQTELLLFLRLEKLFSFLFIPFSLIFYPTYIIVVLRQNVKDIFGIADMSI